jgi:hypothetical protein
VLQGNVAMDQGFKGSMISMWQGLHNRYLIADFSFSAALNASETANFSALLSY